MGRIVGDRDVLQQHARDTGTPWAEPQPGRGSAGKCTSGGGRAACFAPDGLHPHLLRTASSKVPEGCGWGTVRVWPEKPRCEGHRNVRRPPNPNPSTPALAPHSPQVSLALGSLSPYSAALLKPSSRSRAWGPVTPSALV